jgi:hypothetical protein
VYQTLQLVPSPAPALHSPVILRDVPHLMERLGRPKVRTAQQKRLREFSRSPGEKIIAGILIPFTSPGPWTVPAHTSEGLVEPYKRHDGGVSSSDPSLCHSCCQSIHSPLQSVSRSAVYQRVQTMSIISCRDENVSPLNSWSSCSILLQISLLSQTNVWLFSRPGVPLKAAMRHKMKH